MNATTQSRDATGMPRSRFGRAYFRYLVEPWIYLSPAIVLICLIMLVPLAIGITYSVQSINLLRPIQSGYVGLENFAELGGDARFWRALTNTVWWTFGSVVLQFFLGLGLAMLLTKPFLCRRVVQAVVFLPWAVPTFLIALTWSWLLNPVIGPLPHWWASMGLIDEPYNILSNPGTAMWGPIMANVWYGVPFFAITLLAALQSIPEELYEAAEIDGASRWQKFTKITLPFLGPMIVITVMLRAIWIANFADLIFIMTGGGPANSTQILASYIFTTAFRKLDFGYASAIAVALLGLLLIYATVFLWIRAKVVKP